MKIPYAMRRGHGFYLRLRTPTDLAPAIGPHLIRTLSTRCPREARARAAQAAADAAAWWNVLRADMLKILGKSLDQLTATDINRNTLAAAAAEMAAMSREDKERIHARLDELVDSLDTERRVGQRALERLRDSIQDMKEARAKGREEALKELLQGMAMPSGVAPQPEPPRSYDDPRRGQTLEILAADYFADKGQGASARVSNLAAFRAFHALIGPKGIASISAADLARYKSHVQNQKGRNGAEKASEATVLKNLGHVRSILTWATVDAGILSENVGKNVRASGKMRKDKEPKRLAFEAATLTKIFASPLFTGCASRSRLADPGPHKAPDSRRFFILAMLLTGARTEELPGAGIIEIDAIPSLNLSETGTKSAAARRYVPILAELKKTGFIEWAREQESAAVPLFRGKDAPTDWSKWTNSYLKKIEVSDAQHVAYSFRHNFRQMLRAGNLNQEIGNKIFGHEEGTTGEGYGRALLSSDEARAFLKCVKAPIDLSHLYPPK